MTCLLLFFMTISLINLIYFTYKPLKNLRTIFKTITSLLFIGICISRYSSSNDFTYFILILMGLIFSLFGDIFLIFENGSNKSMSKDFIYGLLSFSIAHIFFSLCFVSLTSLTIYDILFTAILSLSSLLILKSIKNFNFKGVFRYVAFYAVIISFMFIKSISLYLAGFDNFGVFIVMIGALLFVVSDLILSFVYFYKDCPKFMAGLNLLIYYIAQGCIALSVSYM